MKYELSKLDFQAIIFSLTAHRHYLRESLLDHRIVGDAKLEVQHEIERLDKLIRLFRGADTAWIDTSETET